MHQGSRRLFFGTANPPEKLARQFSSELQVTHDTPPTFLFTTDEDRAVPAENSLAFYLALRREKVPAELHVYLHGRHGGGLWDDPATGPWHDPATGGWPQQLLRWMQSLGLAAPSRP